MIEDDLALIDALQLPTGRLGWALHQRATAGPRVRVPTRLPGAGPFTALVLLAGIGDISRFASACKLAARAGLAPAAVTDGGSGTGRLRAEIRLIDLCGHRLMKGDHECRAE